MFFCFKKKDLTIIFIIPQNLLVSNLAYHQSNAHHVMLHVTDQRSSTFKSNMQRITHLCLNAFGRFINIKCSKLSKFLFQVYELKSHAEYQQSPRIPAKCVWTFHKHQMFEAIEVSFSSVRIKVTCRIPAKSPNTSKVQCITFLSCIVPLLNKLIRGAFTTGDLTTGD